MGKPLLATPKSKDTVHFGSHKTSQYNSASHLENLHQVQRHAQRAQVRRPNLSERYYGAMAVLENGVVSEPTTNIEATRQCSICDLRSAIIGACNRDIDQFKTHDLKSPPPKVETIYLANADPETQTPIPCADCQSWLSSDLCQPETQVISLEYDPEQGQETVRTRTVADMLPLHAGRNLSKIRMTTDQPIHQLPVELSQNAQQSLEQAKLSPQQMAKMLKKAQKAYQRNSTAPDSQLKTGVALKFNLFNHVVSGGRFDWTTRWSMAPDVLIGAFFSQMIEERVQPRLQRIQKRLPKALQTKLDKWLVKPLSRPMVQAVAYYGDDPKLPPITSLGRFGRRRGSSQTLIITVENDRLQVRTIADFMPEMYQTPPK